MAKSSKLSVGRRGFLKGAAAGAMTGAAAIVGGTSVAEAQQAQSTAAPAVRPPSAAERATENLAGASAEIQIVERPGSDYMVDVIKSLPVEYIFASPGSSFRSLHESVVNYGGNKPEFITCTHEEIGVAMGNGYAKIEGKPALSMAHGTVGCQHAAMAVYNAYCDQVPNILILGNIANAAERRGSVEWLHSVQDAAAMLREFTKWDDNPASLQHFGESTVRAYQLAMTPPTMPVVLVADGELQESPIPADANLRIPKYVVPSPPAGDSSTVNEIAKMLVAAENPVIVTSRSARTPAGLRSLIELAELLQCAVIDQHRRMNFPSRHPLNQSWNSRGVVGNADVILGLETYDFYGVVHALGGQTKVIPRSITKPGVKLVSISSSDLFYKSNYQNFERFQDVDIAIAADAEATLPSLIEAVQKLVTPDRKRVFQARGAKLADASKQSLEQNRTNATYAWDASPISTARMSAELWAQLRNEDWSLVSDTIWISYWPLRLWDFDKHYHYIGGAGGEGVGYMAPAALGAAVANKKHGRLSVCIQSDGDLMMAPGTLWTSAHHKIPMLTLMHNNRAYHMEIMQLQRMANQHNRGIDTCGIGTTITDPNINYAQMAKSMGVEAEGPIADPAALGPAIKRGIEAVKRGNPYLIDVITQPR
ncbi:MAG TPA: thiamine pyrophosphate-dependent enzyme [Bryobacteraceae bacterium]|nr:thiamine pyrophosphate-dependent enzyme [Bryobacteraceae bacterium]